MKRFLFLTFVLLGSIPWAQAALIDDDAAKNTAQDRLAKSAIALQTFRGNATGAAQTLFNQALCVGVAPRRDPGPSASDENGFVSCRSSQAAAWSNPAAFVIEGGGVFWPVVGAEADLIMLATNQSAAAHFGDPKGYLGSDVRTKAGPSSQDRISPQANDAAIFAYGQSTTGIVGLDLAGALMNEDKATNAAVYGQELTNLAILRQNSGGGQKPANVDLFLAALPSSSAGQSRAPGEK